MLPQGLARGRAVVDRPSLRRSVELFRAFRVEQTDPDRFYDALAADSIWLLSRWTGLDGLTVLDIGGGPGYFADAFAQAGARYAGLEPDAGELTARGGITGSAVRGSGLDLPVADRSVDLAFSSNVLEHVPDPRRMADEMVRVTRPGGVTFISYTVWFGPWGGHETAPWHYLGGMRARWRYARRHGRQPKNRFGESLFPVTVRAGLVWARSQTAADVLDVSPRYHPRWSRRVLQVPMLREVVTWNLMIVLRKR
jgi:SAM-dependent methyltransferase